MNCTHPFIIYPKRTSRDVNTDEMYPRGFFEVPCGKCLPCRIARTREWSLRIIHELPYWEHATFVTFTYKPEFLPPGGTLEKKHLQDFFKRLRKSIAPRKIRYYASGEYGDKKGRPHYHAIIFGISLPEAQKTFPDLWPMGRFFKKNFGLVTYDSARYVAQYLDTKLYGDLAEEVYTSKGLAVPF